MFMHVYVVTMLVATVAFLWGHRNETWAGLAIYVHSDKPNYNIQVHVRKKIIILCECGYVFCNKVIIYGI